MVPCNIGEINQVVLNLIVMVPMLSAIVFLREPKEI